MNDGQALLYLLLAGPVGVGLGVAARDALRAARRTRRAHRHSSGHQPTLTTLQETR